MGIRQSAREAHQRTCRDGGNDEPQHSGHSLKDPAPVGHGGVGGPAVGVLEGVVPDLDSSRAVVRQLHADDNDPARSVMSHPLRLLCGVARIAWLIGQLPRHGIQPSYVITHEGMCLAGAQRNGHHSSEEVAHPTGTAAQQMWEPAPPHSENRK